MTEQEKQAVEELTRSFTRMETLYKVKCTEVETRKEEIERLKSENAALRERLEKAVELPFCPDDYHIELDLARIIVSTRNQSCTIAIPIYAYINCEDENSAEARLAELKGEKK